MEDINKIEHVGQTVDGCKNGKHLPDEREGHSTVERDGDLTKIIMRCLLCNENISISAPFGLNKYIGQPTQDAVPIEKSNNTINTDEPDFGSDILKRLLG